ncbi:TonB-dependent receptor plug domain-containing protein [Arsukibacterium sp.]|uniref:TonB-dependent receptor plug domain-containing protein n=1 Tax=Arsukibacterium sp. TaxID=1977258 RepID=UPI002FDB11F4
MYIKATMKRSKLSLATLLAMTGVSSPLMAEEGITEQKIEKIEITGSRLKGVDMEGANPVQIFNREDLANRGYDSVSAFLRDLPQAASAGTFSENGATATASGAPAGSSGVSLRGLGSSSTLVLVNGRRVAVDSFANGADSFVNVNTIPMSAIERIEVLTDGASSVYGSDAIAGVINFILRKDFEGHELSLMYGDDNKSSDFGRYNLTYVGGFNTATSNTTVVLDYFNRNALFNVDRPIDVTFALRTSLGIAGVNSPEQWCGTNTVRGGTECRYDYVSERAIQPETENLGVNLSHLQQLDNNLEFFGEAMYQRNQGSAYDSATAYTVTVPFNASFVPAYVQDRNPTNANIIVRTRFPERRQQSFDTESLRLLAGLRGELADWSWETAASFGQTDNEVRHIRGYFNRAGVLAGIANQSFNPFNLGRDNSEATLAALREQAPRVGSSETYSLDFNISGDLFELPSGAVAAVFGGEYRSEDIKDTPAPIAAADGVYGLGARDAQASRNQFAVYGEFNLPITDTLDAIAAIRYDRYSDFGGDVNPKLSLRWRATDNFIARASWSTGFRAPSLSQLGAGQALATGYINCGPGEEFDALCGSFTDEVSFDQETRGNPDLSAESSEAVNIGFSWNLSDNLQLTADYWRYDHQDIVDVDANTTLRNCLAGTAPTVTDESNLPGFGCVVSTDGDLVFLRTGFFNVGQQKTDGVDVKLNYRLQTEQAGRFNFYANATKTLSYERQISPDFPAEDLLGKLSGANEVARPDFVADFGTDWTLNNWSASLSGKYVASMGDGDFKFNNEEVKAWLVFNASVGYDFADYGRVNLAVRNITDKKPPYASSPTDGYASSIHDWLGSVWTLRYTINF